MPLTEWLEQPISIEGGRSVTIRQLIRRVCDQDGGAHVDLKPQAWLAGLPDAPR